MDATTTTAIQLITCDGCGTQVPYTDSYYVDGAGQLCTANCTTPIPEGLRHRAALLIVGRPRRPFAQLLMCDWCVRTGRSSSVPRRAVSTCAVPMPEFRM